MSSLWRVSKIRIGGVLAAGGLLVGLMFIVFPALASTANGPVPPPSTAGVMPIDVDTGGQSNDCAVFSSTAANQFRIANPKSKTYSTSVNGAPVTFTVKLNPGPTNLPAYANQKYMDVSSTGAAIVDIGVKGGTDETDYDYSVLPAGYVTADGALHAPAQATDSETGLPTTLYSISNLTFCFDVRGSVSGTVYHDLNQNGQNDDNSPQSAWTLHLYQGTTLVKTTTSGSGGSYAFALQLATGSQYTVCEVPPSGTWAQTQPSPSDTNVCSAAGELVKGYRFTPASTTQQISGKDFGNVPSQLCVPGPFGEPGYEIQLAACKPNQSYVFNSGTTPGGKPFVSVTAGDQTNTTEEPLVEKITWPYDPTQGQNQLELHYTDVFPYDLTKLKTMQYCKLDPRDGSEFTLEPPYDTIVSKGDILPGTETSCLISTTESADGTYVAYVYSAIDGLRTTQP